MFEVGEIPTAFAEEKSTGKNDAVIQQNPETLFVFVLKRPNFIGKAINKYFRKKW